MELKKKKEKIIEKYLFIYHNGYFTFVLLTDYYPVGHIQGLKFWIYRPIYQITVRFEAISVIDNSLIEISRKCR